MIVLALEPALGVPYLLYSAATKLHPLDRACNRRPDLRHHRVRVLQGILAAHRSQEW